MNTKNQQGDLFGFEQEVSSDHDTKSLVETSKNRTYWVLRNIWDSIVEHDTYFQVDGWKVSKENLWEPTLGSKSIQINPAFYMPDKAQAWRRYIDEKIYWYYNYKGALDESKHQGLYLPTHIELAQMLDSIKLSNSQKAQALSIPLSGHLVEGRFRPNDLDVISFLWSRLSYDELNAIYVTINTKHKRTSDSPGNRKRAFSVRTFLDENNFFKR